MHCYLTYFGKLNQRIIKRKQCTFVGHQMFALCMLLIQGGVQMWASSYGCDSLHTRTWRTHIYNRVPYTPLLNEVWKLKRMFAFYCTKCEWKVFIFYKISFLIIDVLFKYKLCYYDIHIKLALLAMWNNINLFYNILY